MNKRPKSLAKFRSEAEERQFWTQDSSEYIEQGRAGALSKSKAIHELQYRYACRWRSLSALELPLINAMCFINL